jgi:hypothetical protein
MQMLCKRHQALESHPQVLEEQAVFDSSIFHTIHSHKVSTDAGLGLTWTLYELTYSTRSFASILSTAATRAGYSRSVWIPAPIVETVLPNVVSSYGMTGVDAPSLALGTHEVVDLTMDEDEPSERMENMADSDFIRAPTNNRLMATPSGSSVNDAIDLTSDDEIGGYSLYSQYIDLTGDDAEGLFSLHFLYCITV